MIRNARTEDIRGLAELELACFSDSWSEQLLESGMNCSYDDYLVLEEDGQLIGYGVLRTLADESEIQRIAVGTDFRRRGYARELLERMVAVSREKQAVSMILEVRASNQAAISLYKSIGFWEEGRRRGYYHHPEEDALLMRFASHTTFTT